MAKFNKAESTGSSAGKILAVVLSAAAVLALLILAVILLFGIEWKTTVGICYGTTTDPSNAAYRQLLEGADARILISREYTRDCMLKRNRYMVHHASVCIAYCTKDTGGTAYTVRYARDTGKTVLFI